MENFITSNEMLQHRIQIHEPFSEFLGGEQEEFRFALTLLDVVHLSGHACPAMVGAFLLSQRAVRELFPDTEVCIRGDVMVSLPGRADEGATGPISNVFSLIFGAWSENGFGGLQGRFRRRGLLEYNAGHVAQGKVKFKRLSTGHEIELGLDFSRLSPPQDLQSEFQKKWRWTITEMMKNPESVVR